MTEWWQGFVVGAGAHVLWDVGLVLLGACGGAALEHIKHNRHTCVKSYIRGRWGRRRKPQTNGHTG